MSPEIAKLIEETHSQHFETTSNAITSIALLLERISMSRESDAAYEPLLPEHLYKHQLSLNEIDALIHTAIEILRSDSHVAGSAAWALGKTYSAKVVPELIASLKHWREHDDFTVYNLLIALENCGGLESAWDLIEEISQVRGDKPSSVEFAQRRIARKDAS